VSAPNAGSRSVSLGAARRPAAVTAAGVVGFAVAIALAAQVSIPIPGTPVPITLQPMLVVLAGLTLGPAAAASSMVLYLLAGAAGLPVFTPQGAPGLLRFMGPTGGYLLAYPLAAWVAGRLSSGSKRYAVRALAAIAGMAVLYTGGLAQLTLLTGSLSSAALLGLLPFVGLDVLKALAAAALAPARRVGG